MNWVDLVIAGVVAWTTFLGFSTGLIRQAVWLIAILLGIVLAGALYDDLAANLDFIIEDQTTRNLIAFGAITAGAVIAGAVIGQVLQTTAGLLMLGPIDKIGGAALGFIRGVLYVQVLLFMLAVFPANEAISKGIADSRLGRYFLDDASIIDQMLPDRFEEPLDQLDGWRETLSLLLPALEEASQAASDAATDGDAGAESPAH